jgi:hypothetical protein
MHAKTALIAMVNDARSWLKGWADGFTDAEAVDAAGCPANPLAWQLGHVACTQDEVANLFGDGGRQVPDSLREVCGPGTPAPTKSTRYPRLAEIWSLLDRTQTRLLAMVDASDEAGFDREPRTPNDFFKSFGQAVYDISMHETYHVGMVAILRKAHGKPSLG